ncbi:MAG: hypothetical protein M1817_005728 [Caeruleum heppii]|nr:MAG: hypothetical protein M1817_005728 [Caeruleum heppii]
MPPATASPPLPVRRRPRFKVHEHIAPIFYGKAMNHIPFSFSLCPSSSSKPLQLLRRIARYQTETTSKYDAPSHTLRAFIPSSASDAYLAIRSLNISLSQIGDAVSNPHVGSLRIQYWRDAITKTFAGTPPKEPVAALLRHALDALQQRTGTQQGMNKTWLMRVIAAREQYLQNPPYRDLAALEAYAESTYSTLLYLTLSALPLQSLAVDHVASHIGKATGIVTVLRGLPLLAFPPPPNHHSNTAGLGGMLGTSTGQRQGAVTLPLEVMAQAGMKEEDVLRLGATAPGLRDAVFAVATRANDHLITAREMLKSIRAGQEVDHDFEHEGEEGHEYITTESTRKGTVNAAEEVRKGFGVLMPAVATSLWLQRLEKLDFDVFREELRMRDWRLPWRAYVAYRRRHL